MKAKQSKGVVKRRQHPNPRLVKINRNYTVEEIAKLFGIHKNTVRMWFKEGLPVIDDCRPALVLGKGLYEFLQTKRSKNKAKCQPGELYCFRCRKPRRPAHDMVDYHGVTDAIGNLVGICPVCETLMNQRIGKARLQTIKQYLGVTFT
jgi:hypothetical protein